MKILSITNDFDGGGAGKSLFLSINHLRRMGHHVAVISIAPPHPGTDRLQAYTKMGVPVEIIPYPYLPIQLVACSIPVLRNIKRGIREFPSLLRIKRIIHRWQPSVIHLNSYTTLLAALLVNDYPCVLHAREVIREEDNLFLKPICRYIKNHLHHVIAISPVEAEQTRRLFDLPTTIIPNIPAHPPRYHPVLNGDSLHFGMIGQVTPAKGHLDLIEAATLAKNELKAAGIKIHMYGGELDVHSDLFHAVPSEISKRKLNEFVFFHGRTEAPEEKMVRMHLLIRPDQTGHPWGRDVIEAMSVGRPVLATGNVDTFIKHGINGWLVPPRDPFALATALKAFTSVDRLNQMGKKAAEFACKHFNPDTNTTIMSDVFNQTAILKS